MYFLFDISLSEVGFLITVILSKLYYARKLYGGTVHVLKLERVELTDGNIHQECSLDRQLKS